MYHEEKTRHYEGNVYKNLCAVSNDMMKKPKGTEAFDGWEVVEKQFDPKTNFKGILYEKNGQYVMCFVGTDKFSAKDHAANIQMGLLGKNKQMDMANEFYKDLTYKYKLSAANTRIAGHSEGGTEATFVGIQNNIKTYTYNAFGISKKLIDKNKNYDDLVINYRDGHDPVSKLRSNIGKTYIMNSTQNTFMSHTPFGSIQSHGIINMGDCEKAVPIDEYKKSHPLFLDRITDAVITREDIKNMPQDLYRVYENELEKRLANDDIPSVSEANYRTAKGDMVYVSAYTRDDGAEVSGYYRRLPVR